MFSRAVAADTLVPRASRARLPCAGADSSRGDSLTIGTIGTIGRISVHRQGRTSSDGSRSLPPQTRYIPGRISRDRART